MRISVARASRRWRAEAADSPQSPSIGGPGDRGGELSVYWHLCPAGSPRSFDGAAAASALAAAFAALSVAAFAAAFAAAPALRRAAALGPPLPSPSPRRRAAARGSPANYPVESVPHVVGSNYDLRDGAWAGTRPVRAASSESFVSIVNTSTLGWSAAILWHQSSASLCVKRVEVLSRGPLPLHHLIHGMPQNFGSTIAN